MLEPAYRVSSVPAEPGTLSPSAPYRAVKQAGLVLLCAAWIVLGLVGHDPWKTEDAMAFGVVWDMMRGGSMLAPTLAGEPFLDSPPLVYAIAAVFGHAFSPLLPPHDAARLAVGAMLSLALIFVSLAATELYGRAWRWLSVLLFAGSLGLWERGHQLSPELGVVVGVAIATYGFALALRRPIAGGVGLGIGVAVAFLSDGFGAPLWLAASALALPAAFASWRERAYATTAATALAIALPLGLAWPGLLALSAPEHLSAWWGARSIGEHVAPLAQGGWNDPAYTLKNLPWFGWPALPLALWALWMRVRGFNGGLAQPGIQLPATLLTVFVLGVSLSADPRPTQLMPILVPLVLLGAIEIDTLARGFSAAFDWFGILTFGLLALLVWGLWFDTRLNGMSLAVARLFRDTEIGYQPTFSLFTFGVSLFLTLLWLALVRPARRSNRRAVLNWTAGMVLVWGLYTTIWLPYLDSRRSYRGVAASLALALPAQGCVASRNVGTTQRALFAYFANLTTVREERDPGHRCNHLLVQHGRLDAEPPPPEGWRQVWEGRRRGDDTEHYFLYRRSGPA